MLFAEEDNFIEPEVDDDKFFVALRLSPRPEHLVKGYEFQMLNKWVCVMVSGVSVSVSPFQICWHVHPQQPQPDNQIPQHQLASLQTHGRLRHLQLGEFMKTCDFACDKQVQKGHKLQLMIM